MHNDAQHLNATTSMKTHKPRAVIKTAHERYAEWREHVCPYCGSDDVMTGVINNGKYRAICFACEVENYFSGPMVKKKPEVTMK